MDALLITSTICSNFVIIDKVAGIRQLTLVLSCFLKGEDEGQVGMALS